MLQRRATSVRGVYLHGSVGRGKTWLTETLLHQLPPEGVLRLHAYDAARQLHAHVARAVETPGAVQAAVTRLLDGVHLLYLDECRAGDRFDAERHVAWASDPVRVGDRGRLVVALPVIRRSA